MKLWLEIQRTSGIDHRDIKPDGVVGVASGICPGCGTEPFLVQGHGRSRHGSAHTYRAGATAKCCGDSVGFIFAQPETLFGLEEDEAVLNGRARVYGGEVRT